jgi:excisionase family DNA binding protein
MIDETERGLDDSMAPAVKVLTVNELAEYLRVHRSTIYRLLKKGLLPGFKIGSDWRFNVEVIDQWRMRQGAILLSEDAGAPKQ